MAKKKIVRLTQEGLQNLIRESVGNILREGHWNQQVQNEWDDLRNAIGDEAMISELYNWLEGDDMEDFIRHTKQMYDLDVEEEEDELEDVSDDLEYEEDPDYPSF